MADVIRKVALMVSIEISDQTGTTRQELIGVFPTDTDFHKIIDEVEVNYRRHRTTYYKVQINDEGYAEKHQTWRDWDVVK